MKPGLLRRLALKCDGWFKGQELICIDDVVETRAIATDVTNLRARCTPAHHPHTPTQLQLEAASTSPLPSHEAYPGKLGRNNLPHALPAALNPLNKCKQHIVPRIIHARHRENMLPIPLQRRSVPAPAKVPRRIVHTARTVLHPRNEE
ncbi:tannase and feruloyl esterase [Colletotrichum scovillei]|uniref:Tannase and feruloyl esterase n=1 Tax=Colletotrichum scovillei TaxID=1209932 RepID=A0A9P7QW47_9PEZI|nr:tannase and feruloyl esterase [Colletotrichum scovillei]KAG7045828.1 tannase and feruloyl esterase [Colletotrichum scovillei]KAG7063172.1 tannase and feruloyl esterase [Colletotrichum scovillei]